MLSVIDLVMTAFVLDLWLRRSHVVINPKGLKVHRAWFAFKQEQNFPAAARFNSSPPMWARPPAMPLIMI